jgi:hypothetical protein
MHLGMFYDAMKVGKKSASYMKERLNFLRNNIDKENSLVAEGFIDNDKKLVDAMDLVLKNKELKDIIDSYKQKSFNKKANKDSGYDAKKRLYVNAAKAVADANTVNKLITSISSKINSDLYDMYSAVDRLFVDGKISKDLLT